MTRVTWDSSVKTCVRPAPRQRTLEELWYPSAYLHRVLRILLGPASGEPRREDTLEGLGLISS